MQAANASCIQHLPQPVDLLSLVGHLCCDRGTALERGDLFVQVVWSDITCPAGVWCFQVTQAHADGSELLQDALVIGGQPLSFSEEPLGVVQDFCGCDVERCVVAGIHAFSGALQEQSEAQKFGGVRWLL